MKGKRWRVSNEGERMSRVEKQLICLALSADKSYPEITEILPEDYTQILPQDYTQILPKDYAQILP